jgi:hypothetical protein
MKATFLIVNLAASIISAAELSAQIVFGGGESSANLQLNGDASIIDDALRLTLPERGSSGSFFTTNAIALGTGNEFSVFFQVRISGSGGIGDEDGQGADGLVFVIQTVSNSLGSSGGGIGIQGISPSVAIEIDTFENGEYNDTNGNHVGIDINGNLESVVSVIEARRFNDGQIWNVWVDYAESDDLLEVRWALESSRPNEPMLTYSIDLVDLLGQNQAFIGVTSATGSGWGNHEILFLEFRDADSPINLTPEQLTIGNAVSLDIDTVQNKIYVIEGSNDLENWEVVKSGIIGDGTTQTVFFKVASPKHFFRASSILPE